LLLDFLLTMPHDIVEHIEIVAKVDSFQVSIFTQVKVKASGQPLELVFGKAPQDRHLLFH